MPGIMRNRLASDGVLDYQNIIFLSHSMGGLIVREFMLQNREVAKRVKFAYFYATPTEGSQTARLANLVSKNPQFKNMSPLESNNDLANLQRNWLSANFELKSFCAYESLDTYGVKVVGQGSATNLCTEPLTPMPYSHSQIVKPKNMQDDRYLAFKSAYLSFHNDLSPAIRIASGLILNEKYIIPSKNNKTDDIIINRAKKRDSDDFGRENKIYTMLVVKDFAIQKNNQCSIVVSARLYNSEGTCDEALRLRIIEQSDEWKTDLSVERIIKSAKERFNLDDTAYLMTDEWQFEDKCYDDKRYVFEIELYDEQTGKSALRRFPVELQSNSKK